MYWYSIKAQISERNIYSIEINESKSIVSLVTALALMLDLFKRHTF